MFLQLMITNSSFRKEAWEGNNINNSDEGASEQWKENWYYGKARGPLKHHIDGAWL